MLFPILLVALYTSAFSCAAPLHSARNEPINSADSTQSGALGSPENGAPLMEQILSGYWGHRAKREVKVSADAEGSDADASGSFDLAPDLTSVIEGLRNSTTNGTFV